MRARGFADAPEREVISKSGQTVDTVPAQMHCRVCRDVDDLATSVLVHLDGTRSERIPAVRSQRTPRCSPPSATPSGPRPPTTSPTVSDRLPVPCELPVKHQSRSADTRRVVAPSNVPRRGASRHPAGAPGEGLARPWACRHSRASSRMAVLPGKGPLDPDEPRSWPLTRGQLMLCTGRVQRRRSRLGVAHGASRQVVARRSRPVVGPTRVDSVLQGSRPGRRGGVMERTRAEDPPHCNPWRGSLLVVPTWFSRPSMSSEHHPFCSGVAGAEPSVRLRLLMRSATDSLDTDVGLPASGTWQRGRFLAEAMTTRPTLTAAPGCSSSS